MKRTILFYFILVIGLLQTSQAFSYDFSFQSVLSSGKWAKIRVKETGICKLTYDQIKQMGFKNPSEIRIFGYGGTTLSEDLSNPKTDDLNELPIYQGSNFFLFYAKGPKNWYYNTTPNSVPDYKYSINPYSNYGYYFITDNVGSKKRVSTKKIEILDANTIAVRKYQDKQIHKKEEFNYVASGKGWYGDKFFNNNSISYSFNFPNIDTTEYAYLYANIATSSNVKSHIDYTFNFGGKTVTDTIEYPICATHIIANELVKWASEKPSNSQLSISAKFRGSNSADFASIDRIIATAYRPLEMGKTNTFFFQNPKCNDIFTNYQFIIANCPSSTQIWDISNAEEPMQIKTEKIKDSLVFTDVCKYYSIPNEYVAINMANPTTISAEFVGNVSNQNLHAVEPVDFVIITHPNFITGANEIAKIHEEYDNFSTYITTPEKIYNEFSSGTPDATAFRWFMKKLYQQNGEKPFYLLIIGDGCYDNRGLLASSGTTINNFVVTYQSGSNVEESATYVTDDYFAFLSDIYKNNGNAQMNIAVGRIPCSTSTELDGVIKKIRNHVENKNYGKWKNKILLLADDNESTNDYQKFCRYCDVLANKVHVYNNAMEVKKVYLDSYTRTTGSNGSRYYEVEDIIKEEIDNGVMFFNYVGHSSKIGFTAEHVFTQNQAGSIYNDKCGFWFTASCEFSQFDDLDHSGGEDLLLNPNGGALVLISSARVAYDNKNDNLNQAIFTELFLRDSTGMPRRIGDVLRSAKCSLSNDSNKLSFNLLGDPALRLCYPNNKVITDSIVEIGNSLSDTLKALSNMVIYGHVADNDSANINDFNGTLYVTLYDKEVSLYTKANIYTEEDEIIKNRHQYKDRPNILFSGQVEVVDGDFSFSLKVPKDINYNYGTGRLSYYAYDQENDYEAQGAYEEFFIGGSCNNVDYENDGPAVTLYMNTESFVSGDKINSSPIFYAKLSDESGINASGCGIGHDITLTLNDSKTPIILNNYFTYSKDSYKNGTVSYQLANLENGSYTLTFKAWDLLNNSTTKSIQFVVDNDIEIGIEDLVVYPNPAKESITLKLTHDQPQTIQSFRFLLFDINGRIVYESEEIASKNDGTLFWEWDLTTQSGRRIDAGSYIGRAEIKTNGKKYIGKSKKIIVLPQ